MSSANTSKIANTENSIFLFNVRCIIDQNACDPQFAVPVLAELLYLSTEQLGQQFKALTDTLPGECLRTARLRHAACLLAGSDYSVKGIATMSGFLSYQGFWQSFTGWYGQSPLLYRAEHSSKNQGLSRPAVWAMPPGAAVREELVRLMQTDPRMMSFFQTLVDCLGDESLTIDDLAHPLHLCASQLTRIVKKELNITPMRLLRDLRLLLGAERLAYSSDSVATIAYTTGFFDQSHFSRTFTKAFSCSPAVYRKQKRHPDFYSWLKICTH